MHAFCNFSLVIHTFVNVMKCCSETGFYSQYKTLAPNTCIFPMYDIPVLSENCLLLQPAGHAQQGVSEPGPAGGRGKEHEAGTGGPHTEDLLHGHQAAEAAPGASGQQSLLHAVIVLHLSGSGHVQPL